MDIVSLYFFTELSKDLHMTHAAERLYISQQTLSNHIARLERYYGATLFERQPEPHLTPVGELVLSYARIVCEGDANLLRKIAEIKDGNRGTIHMGASAVRAASCLPPIFAEFRARFPHVTLEVVNATTPRLEKMVANDEIDFAITVDASETQIAQRHIFDDDIYLCVRTSLIEHTYGQRAAEVLAQLEGVARLDVLAEVPICLLDNYAGRYIRRAYSTAAVEPDIVCTVSNFRIGLDMCCAGALAAFSTKSTIHSDLRDRPDDLLVLPVMMEHEAAHLRLSLSYLPQRHRPGYVQELMSLIEGYYVSIA